jgi:PhnB protein
MGVKPVPDGHNSVSPYLVIERATILIDFLKHTFTATELGRSLRADGTIRHAEVKIGDSVVMLGEATGEFTPMPCMINVYVEDTDVVYQRALQAGATSIREPADQEHGDRTAGVTDPFGNQWWIATHKEDVAWSSD